MNTNREEMTMTDLLTTTENGTRAQAEVPLREQAILQLKKKRDFRTHVVAYVLVNAVFWLIWAVLLLAADGPLLPWPLFPMAGWGIGLFFHAWDTYGRKAFTESDIEHELARLRRTEG
jgi:2TM domain-containing protein